MPYLINPLENGKFELIDEHFIELYDVDEENLVPISDDEYRTHQQKTNHLTTFEQGKFVYRDAVVDEFAIKSELQTQAWERIKQKRHDNARGGVFIKSIGKWFHNDDPSRTQYLALQVLPSLPPDLVWKTMDNEFVPMTKDLLNEIAMTMLVEEQSDFANAEKHRLAMLQADNPLDYDYSAGWSRTHGQ